ncbi:hypothetical protein [Romboutsia sp.]|uniref:hypothetical protein n=1 Tax=Romboutsia sp. TaxID=1965302 RepID=UPI002CB7B5E8|nr:hypothetical protein [Romboutsia sp.]HSQ90009.1 hypothetical protein [Romboutsia sp.]
MSEYNNNKKLKKRLFKYKENKAKLESKKLKLDNMYSNISPNCSGMPGGSGGINSKVESHILEKDILENEIKDLEYEIKEIDIALNVLTKKEYTVIELRYLEEYKPSEVYNELHISERSFWREHSRIMQKMENVIKK